MALSILAFQCTCRLTKTCSYTHTHTHTHTAAVHGFLHDLLNFGHSSAAPRIQQLGQGIRMYVLYRLVSRSVPQSASFRLSHIWAGLHCFVVAVAYLIVKHFTCRVALQVSLLLKLLSSITFVDSSQLPVFWLLSHVFWWKILSPCYICMLARMACVFFLPCKHAHALVYSDYPCVCMHAYICAGQAHAVHVCVCVYFLDSV